MRLAPDRQRVRWSVSITVVWIAVLAMPGESAEVEPRRLNNLVTELVHYRTRGSESHQQIEFINLRSGWIYVGCDPGSSWRGNVITMKCRLWTRPAR